jgi:hypothetical protein
MYVYVREFAPCMIEGLLISSEQMTPIHHTGGRQIYSVFRGGGGGGGGL